MHCVTRAFCVDCYGSLREVRRQGTIVGEDPYLRVTWSQVVVRHDPLHGNRVVVLAEVGGTAYVVRASNVDAHNDPLFRTPN